jgi:hypothetical protein
LKPKKKVIENITIETPNSDLNKIYIYIRNWKRIYPIPYVFYPEINKIKEILKNAIKS